MGADLFGSFAESTSATLVVASTISAFKYNEALNQDGAPMYYPIFISAFGIIVCLVTSLIATCSKVDEIPKI